VSDGYCRRGSFHVARKSRPVEKSCKIFRLQRNYSIYLQASHLERIEDRIYTGWLKKVSCILWWIFQQSSTIFFTFFHCYIEQEICNKEVITDVTTPKKGTTLPCKILIFKNSIDRKHSNGRPGVRMLKKM